MKIYKNQNVYEASIERLKYIFEEFENVLVAFSGGKDSGVLLNLVYEYARENNMLNKLSMYHLDYEAQYTYTTEYVERSFLENFKEIKKYWLCLPIAAQCACSMHQSFWTPWEKDKKGIWAREMPKNEYLITEENVPFKFEQNEWDYDVQDKFCKWFSNENGKTAILIGIRTDESLNRFRAIASDKKTNNYKEKIWINGYGDEKTYKAYPIYDWGVEDIWVANAKFAFDYNKLYDIMYQAGVSIDAMRVASPFNDAAINSLKLYKVIEPNMWAKLVGRVNGVNFAGIYGGTTAMGWKSIKLPKGHTWKSYMEFLLSTLPVETRENYMKKLDVSKKSWIVGGAMDQETIRELEEEGAPLVRTGKISSRGAKDKEVIQFNDYVDDTTIKNFKRIPSYKRMCICIMKNDHLCKYMGFGQNKVEKEKRKNVMDKYKSIMNGGKE